MKKSNLSSPLKRKTKWSVAFHVFVFCLFLNWVGCAPMVVQSPSQAYSPSNVVNEQGASRLLLFGTDVVEYFRSNKQVFGRAEFKTQYEKITLYFSSSENLELFKSNPEKYLPQFGGYCANGIVYGIPWGGSPETFLIFNEKLYIFGGQTSMDAFMLNPDENFKYANSYWDQEIQGSNALFQRIKRLIFKVGHYKTSEELAELIQRKKN